MDEAILAHGLGPRSHRRHAPHRGDAHRLRSLPAVPQARERQPVRLPEGPAGAGHDRGGRGGRSFEGGRHHRGGDGGQYWPRPRAGRCPQGLPHRAGGARQDGAREGPARQGHGRRGRDHALGRGEGASGLLPGPRGGDHAPHAWQLLREPVRQSGQSARPRNDYRARNPAADGWGPGRRRHGHRLGRHAHRDRSFHAAGVAQDRDDPRRSQGLGAGALGRDRKDDGGGELGGRRHRRGFRAAERRSLFGVAGLRDPGRRELRDGARAPACRGRARRLLVGHVAGGGAALLQGAVRAEAGGEPRLRFGCEISVQGVQPDLPGPGRLDPPQPPRHGA